MFTVMPACFHWAWSCCRVRASSTLGRPERVNVRPLWPVSASYWLTWVLAWARS